MVRNGNKFVKEDHVFIAPDAKYSEPYGTFYPTKEEAITHGTSPNGVGLCITTIECDGQTWYQAHNTNVWN